MNINTLIVYYSRTGTNYALSLWAQEAALNEGSSVRLRKLNDIVDEYTVNKNPLWKKHKEETINIPIATSDDLLWADCIIFSSPTYFGNVATEFKNFIDMQGEIWSAGKLKNKLVTAMTTASCMHGGHEATIKNIYASMMHWGAIIVPLGYDDNLPLSCGGNPYGSSVTIEDSRMIEKVKPSVIFQTKKIIQITSWMLIGKSV